METFFFQVWSLAMAKQGYHHGNLRNQLIHETISALHEVGHREITLRGMSRKIGVSHSAPYRHFSDKRALLCAVAAEGFRMLTSAIRSEMEEDEPVSVLQIEQIGVAYVRFAVENQELYHLMFGNDEIKENPSAELLEEATKAYSFAEGVFSKAQENGLLDTTSYPNPMNVIWAALHGLASLIINDQIANASGDDISLMLIQDSRSHIKTDIYDLVRGTLRMMLRGLEREERSAGPKVRSPI